MCMKCQSILHKIDNVYEMSRPIFWEKEEKYQFVVCFASRVVKVKFSGSVRVEEIFQLSQVTRYLITIICCSFSPILDTSTESNTDFIFKY